MEWAAIAILAILFAVVVYKKITKAKAKKSAKHKDDIYPLW
jgi:hypothetical protein